MPSDYKYKAFKFNVSTTNQKHKELVDILEQYNSWERNRIIVDILIAVLVSKEPLQGVNTLAERVDSLERSINALNLKVAVRESHEKQDFYEKSIDIPQQQNSFADDGDADALPDGVFDFLSSFGNS